MKKFDKNKEYGTYIVVYNEDKIGKAKKALCDNMKLVVPKKLQKFVSYPITYQKFVTITVKKDNLKQLGSTREEIDKKLNMREHWSVGWIYRRTG